MISSLKHLLKTTVVWIALTVLPAQAVPVIQNPNFSIGPGGAQFDDWTLLGTGITEAGPGATGIATGPGNNVAVLTSSGGPANQTDAETALGLDALALSGFPYSESIRNGAILTQLFTSGFAGDQIFFDARFMMDEPVADLDVGFAVLADPSAGGAADQIQMIGSGSLGQGPTQNFSFTLLRDATLGNPLLLGFGVFNTLDTQVNSRLGIANIVGIANSPSGVPEIDGSSATLPIAVSLITLMLLGDRRTRTRLSLTAV